MGICKSLTNFLRLKFPPSYKPFVFLHASSDFAADLHRTCTGPQMVAALARMAAVPPTN